LISRGGHCSILVVAGGSVALGIVGVVVVSADVAVGLRRFGSGEVGSEGGLCVLDGDRGGGGGVVVGDIAWLGVGLVVGQTSGRAAGVAWVRDL